MRLAPPVFALGLLTMTSAAMAGTITITTETGSGADTTLRRNSTVKAGADTTVAIKKQGEGEDSGNDRIGLLKFDTASLAGAGAITAATLHLQSGGTTSTGNSGNSFLGGHVVHLYGIPDGHAEENWDPATLTYASFDFTTGLNAHHARNPLDVAINGIDDTMAILLGQFTFPSTPQYQPAGTPLTFASVPLAQFLATNSNGIVSFILASMTDGPGQAPVVHSAQSTTLGATIPTLVIETASGTEPVVPEPSTAAALAALAAGAGWRRRR